MSELKYNRTRKASSVASDKGGSTPSSTFAVDLQEDNRLNNYTDVQYQEIRLYIEGVQVPFESISVSSSYMQKPTANISIPPSAGISEIARNYFPKVHIFFRDVQHERYLLSKGIEYDDEDVFKVLFSGVIHRAHYSKTNGASGASARINFQCMHKDYIMDEVIVKYGGRGIEGFSGVPDLSESVAQVNLLDSRQGILKALEGLKPSPGQEKVDIDTFISRYKKGELLEKDIDKVDPNVLGALVSGKFDDLKGVPALLLIMWQIIKMDSYRFTREYTDAMRRLYIPLVDSGLDYFARMKGHRVIEEKIQTDKFKLDDSLLREDETDSTEDVDSPSEIVIPPVFRTFLGKALSTDLAVKLVQTMQIGNKESFSIDQFFAQLLQGIRYDINYLASPVQSVSIQEKSIDKIVKPLLPFYYSPTCNVLLPNMYDTLSITDAYYETPTRVKTINQAPIVAAAESPGNIEYRAPHSVRKAVARANRGAANSRAQPRLDHSLIHRGEVVSDHELGQGIRPKMLQTESWINNLNQSYEDQEADKPEVEKSGVTSADLASLDKLIAGWDNKYPTDGPGLNPWETKERNGLNSYQRNIINTLEYDYSLSVVETRVGQVNGVFNPYVVVGYPCDVLDPSPDRPSYHGFVISVSHTINSAGSMNTSISFTSAISYDEMQSYDMPPVFPWLRVQLGLDAKSNILDQTEATKAIASDYYKDVLGVGFADPTYLYDFSTGTTKKAILNNHYGDFAERAKGNSAFEQSSEGDLYDTVEGNLTLVRREIESMADLKRGKTNVNFIHLSGNRDDDPSIARAVDKSALKEEDRKSTEVFLAKSTDVGKSTFLEYPAYTDKLATITTDSGAIQGDFESGNLS